MIACTPNIFNPLFSVLNELFSKAFITLFKSYKKVSKAFEIYKY